MIIPVKCFSCGNVLANKYRYYCAEVLRQKLLLRTGTTGRRDADADEAAAADGGGGVRYLTKENVDEETVECRVLNALGLKNVCCRRHMLTHVDID